MTFQRDDPYNSTPFRGSIVIEVKFTIIQIDVSVDIWIHWLFVVSPPLSFFVLNSRHLRSYFFFFSWFSWSHCSNFEKVFVFSEVTPTFLSRRYSCILTLSSFQSDVRPFFSFDSFVQVSDPMLSRPAISCFFVDREQINLYCSDRPGLQIWNIVVRQMTSVSSCHWSSRKLVETLSRNVLICLMTSLNISEIGDVSTYGGISVLQGGDTERRVRHTS